METPKTGLCRKYRDWKGPTYIQNLKIIKIKLSRFAANYEELKTGISRKPIETPKTGLSSRSHKKYPLPGPALATAT